MLEKGKKAPSFELAGSDGKKHTLSDYAGKTVVLYFYPKDDTPGCTKEACGFRDLQTAVAERNAVILGVSRDPIASHTKFIIKHQLPFVLLSDPDAHVMKAYGAYGTAEEGVTRSTVVIGPDGNIVKHWAKVSQAETHPETVLEALKKE